MSLLFPPHKSSVSQEDIQAKVQCCLYRGSRGIQRALTKGQGVGLGTNFCFQLLVERGLVTGQKCIQKELRYIYLLKLFEAAKKFERSAESLKSKVLDDEALQVEIDTLTFQFEACFTKV